jgi:hypothetical protein
MMDELPALKTAEGAKHAEFQIPTATLRVLCGWVFGLKTRAARFPAAS